MEQNIIYNSDGVYNIKDIIKEKNDESTINKITILFFSRSWFNLRFNLSQYLRL